METQAPATPKTNHYKPLKIGGFGVKLYDSEPIQKDRQYEVVRKDGKHFIETVREIVWAGEEDGQHVAICTFYKNAGAEVGAPPEQAPAISPIEEARNAFTDILDSM